MIDRKLFEEFREQNWDGYGANPVSEESIKWADKIVNSLPAWMPYPEINCDPDGEVTLDWEDYLSVSVGADGRMVIVWFGASIRARGTMKVSSNDDG